MIVGSFRDLFLFTFQYEAQAVGYLYLRQDLQDLQDFLFSKFWFYPKILGWKSLAEAQRGRDRRVFRESTENEKYVKRNPQIKSHPIGEYENTPNRGTIS